MPKTPKFSDAIPLDEMFFFKLLKDSISLSIEEKANVLRHMPILSLEQVTAMCDTFDEERDKFKKLAQNHPTDIERLTKNAASEWQIVAQEFEIPELGHGSSECLNPRKECGVSDEEQVDRDNYRLARSLSSPSDGDEEEEVQESSPLQLTLEGLVRTPYEIIEELNAVVVGQQEAKKRLASVLYYKLRARNHLLTDPENSEHLMLREEPILMAGPTGTGKSHLVKSAAKAADLDTVITVDASTVVPSGIVGTTISDIGRMIYDRVGRNQKLAEHAVVHLDEFDKLLLKESGLSGVLNEFLILLEGNVPLRIEPDKNDSYRYPTELDTRNMLFILSGSFGIHFERQRTKSIGFIEQPKVKEELNQSQLKDFELPAELRGRIGQIITLEPLSVDALVKVFYQSPTSPLKKLSAQLGLVNCELEVKENAVIALAEQSLEQELGARGLFQAFNNLPIVQHIRMLAPEAERQIFVIERDDIT